MFRKILAILTISAVLLPGPYSVMAAEVSEAEIKALIQQLTSEESVADHSIYERLVTWVRDVAAQKLGDIGRPAIPLLLEKLKEGESEKLCAGLASSFGLMQPENQDLAIPGLLEILKSDKKVARKYAVMLVGDFGGPRAELVVPALIATLQNDPDAENRARAAEALGGLGEELGEKAQAAVPALRQALATEKDPSARKAALFGLNSSGPLAQAALPDIEKISKSDGDQTMPAAAGLVLYNIAEPWKAGTQPIPAIKPPNEQEIKLLVRRLNDSWAVYLPYRKRQEMQMETITYRLSDIGQPALPFLLEKLRKGGSMSIFDSQEVARITCIHLTWAIGFIHEDQEATLSALLDIIQTGKNAAGRLAAVSEVSWLEPSKKEPQRIVPVLMAAVGKEDNPDIRKEAVTVLYHLGPQAAAAVPALIQALETDPETEVRFWAGEALGSIGPKAKAALPALTKAVKRDPASMVRNGALEALARIKASTSGELDPLVLQSLRAKEANMRYCAAEALGFYGPLAKVAVPELIRLVKEDPEESVRHNAMIALGEIASAPELCVPVLIEAAKNPNLYYCEAPVEALAHFGPAAAPAVPRLIELIRDGFPSLQIDAMETIGAIGPPARVAVPILIEVAGAHRWDSCPACAIEALGKIGPDAASAVPVITEQLGSHEESIRLSAAVALGRIGPAARAAIPALRKALQDSDPKVCEAAQEALARLEKD